MKVSEALDTRITCRAFLPKPVPEATLRIILDRAKRAPSGGNLQPWIVYAVTGEPLARFLAIIEEKQKTQLWGEGTEYPIYPVDLKQPYKARSFKCGEDLYATLGIDRHDKSGRLAQFSRNFRAFDAPVLLFFAIDRQMGVDQWADMGMFMQSIMLLAREYGLHSSAQEAWAMWHKTVAQFLDMPGELMLFCGMGIGFMDTEAPVNRLRTERAELEEFVTFTGF
jgi:nitroreductase